jgi:isopenicillin N synthase-like dioxygenase
MRSVPLINLEDFFSEEKRETFIKTLGDAFKELGFVRVKGHQVSRLITDPAYQSIKDFFALEEPLKMKYDLDNGGQRGFTPFLKEHAKDSKTPDLKEFWHVGRELTPQHPLYDVYFKNVWPTEFVEFKQNLLKLYASLEECSDVLLVALAEYLGEKTNIFTDVTDEGNTILRALYYPALNDREVVPGAIRAAAHEDINFITLLIASTSSGLQILTRDGEWLDVVADEGEIIADAGDMLSRVTNGYIPATTHRVINPDDSAQERYSIPFFVHPRPDAILTCLESCKGGPFPEPPRDITGLDFLNERLKEIGLLK